MQAAIVQEISTYQAAALNTYKKSYLYFCHAMYDDSKAILIYSIKIFETKESHCGLLCFFCFPAVSINASYWTNDGNTSPTIVILNCYNTNQSSLENYEQKVLSPGVLMQW